MARDRPLRIDLILDWVAQRSRRSEDGQGLVEYALILSLIAIVAISMLVTIGQPIQTFLSSMGNSI